MKLKKISLWWVKKCSSNNIDFLKWFDRDQFVLLSVVENKAPLCGSARLISFVLYKMDKVNDKMKILLLQRDEHRFKKSLRYLK